MWEGKEGDGKEKGMWVDIGKSKGKGGGERKEDKGKEKQENIIFLKALNNKSPRNFECLL